MTRQEAEHLRALAEAWVRASVRLRVKEIDASTCATSADFAAARDAADKAEEAEQAFEAELRRLTT